MAMCLKCKVEGIRRKATNGRYCQYHYEEAKQKKRAIFIPLRDYHYSLIGRCEKSHWKLYDTYGAKGYTVCEEWQDRETFISWAKRQGYKRGKVLKFKEEGCKVYSPDNCYFGDK